MAFLRFPVIEALRGPVPEEARALLRTLACLRSKKRKAGKLIEAATTWPQFREAMYALTPGWAHDNFDDVPRPRSIPHRPATVTRKFEKQKLRAAVADGERNRHARSLKY